MKTIKVKIGNHLTKSTLTLSSDAPSCRTKEQVRSFINWVVGEKDILFLSSPSNLFEKEKDGELYNCTFSVVYFNVKGEFCHFSITPKGKIKNHCRGDFLLTDSEIKSIVRLNQSLNVTNFSN